MKTIVAKYVCRQCLREFVQPIMETEHFNNHTAQQHVSSGRFNLSAHNCFPDNPHTQYLGVGDLKCFEVTNS